MPLHDWSRVPAALFHHFHQHWTIEIARTLNRGGLPYGKSALVDERMPRLPASLAAELGDSYCKRANRIVVKHHLVRPIAAINIVSPGNKVSQTALRDFVVRVTNDLRVGIHVLVMDVFPPTPRDPNGIHKIIWDEVSEENEFTCPDARNRIVASYEAGSITAYVEPIGVGDPLPDMPLFLTNDSYVTVPLEPTYQAAWDASPDELRLAVETGVIPNPDVE